MRSKLVPLLAAIGALVALPAAAHADTLIEPAGSGKNLAAGGGYLAWIAPAEGATAWQLVIRAPDGTVTSPMIPTFDEPPRISIGSLATPAPNRDVVVVYSRRSGGDDDLYTFNLRTRSERRVPELSHPSYNETVGAAQRGSFVFVRRGGRNNGVYFWNRRSHPRRIATATPGQVAFNGSRVAYTRGNRIVIQRLSGEGRPATLTSPVRPQSITLTRYRAGWLGGGGRVFQTPRFGGSGGPAAATRFGEAGRRLPESTDSIATDGASITRYLDGEGVKSIAPPLFG